MKAPKLQTLYGHASMLLGILTLAVVIGLAAYAAHLGEQGTSRAEQAAARVEAIAEAQALRDAEQLDGISRALARLEEVALTDRAILERLEESQKAIEDLQREIADSNERYQKEQRILLEQIHEDQERLNRKDPVVVEQAPGDPAPQPAPEESKPLLEKILGL